MVISVYFWLKKAEAVSVARGMVRVKGGWALPQGLPARKHEKRAGHATKLSFLTMDPSMRYGRLPAQLFRSPIPKKPIQQGERNTTPIARDPGPTAGNRWPQSSKMTYSLFTARPRLKLP